MDIFELGSRPKTAEVNGVTVRSLALRQKSRLEAIVSREGNRSTKDCEEVRWIALRYGIIDPETNECLLTDKDKQRFPEMESHFVEPIFEKILELSGVSDADREEFEGN